VTGSLAHRRLLGFMLTLLFGVVILGHVSAQPEVVWERSYGTYRYHALLGAFSDGGVLVVADDWLATSIMKLDVKGDVVWEKTYTGVGRASGRDVIEAQDGGFVVMGWTETEQSTGGRVWILDIDRDGNKLWERILDIPMANAICGRKAGGYALSSVAGSGDVLILELDDGGNEIRQRTYTPAPT